MNWEVSAGAELEKNGGAGLAHMHRSRRQIAVNDALGVKQLERRQQLLNDSRCVRGHDPTLRGLYKLRQRLRFVTVHDEVDRLMRVDHRAHAHEVRVRDFGENGTFECEPVQSPKKITLAIGRVRANRYAVRLARNEAPREEFLYDDDVAIQQIFGLIAECKWARSASRSNHAIAVSEEGSSAERLRGIRFLSVDGHTNSGGELPPVIAQRMPM